MSADRILRLRALAKINLSLRIVGIGDDGYHQLRTVFQSITLHDTLTIRVRPGPFDLTCDDPLCPGDQSNLVWRAAERVFAESGRRGTLRDVEIQLKKRIPLQAGLGGGSSDAAATLRALGSLWRVNGAILGKLARELGADVPYFLEGGTVLGLDRGDVLFPLRDHPRAWVVLVIPGFGVSTKDAYAWWDERVDGSNRLRRPYPGRTLSGRPNTAGPPYELGNDLQAPVAVHHPEIAGIVESLQRQGASYAAMSGSGSAVFGFFDRRPTADRAQRTLATKGRTQVSRTVNRAAYQRLAAIRAAR